MVSLVLLLAETLLQPLSLAVHLLLCKDPDVLGQSVPTVHDVLHVVEGWREKIRYVMANGLPDCERYGLKSAR